MSTILYEEVKKDIANNIKYIRKVFCYTQKRLAKEIGVSPTLISNFEDGTLIPSLMNIIKICRLFGVSIDQIIEENCSNYDKSGLTKKEIKIISNSIPLIEKLISIYYGKL